MNKLLILLFVASNTFLFTQNLDSLYTQFDFQSKIGNNIEAEKTMLEISEREAQIFFLMIDTSNTYYKNKNWGDYVSYINKSLSYINDNPSPNTEKFHNRKDSIFENSIELLNEIFTINNDHLTLSVRGTIKMEIKDYQGAIEDFSIALEYDSTNFTTYYCRAMAYSEIFKNQEALADYTRSIYLNSNFSYSLINRGFLHMDMGNYASAIEDFNMSLQSSQIGQDKAYALNNIGYCLYKLEEFEDAKEYIHKSIILYPINSFAYRNLALVQISLKKNEEACKSIMKSIELGFVKVYGNEILELQNKHCQ